MKENLMMQELQEKEKVDGEGDDCPESSEKTCHAGSKTAEAEMMKSKAVPIELASLLNSDSQIQIIEGRVFEGWCESSIPTNEDDFKNQIVEQIRNMKIGYVAARKDATPTNKGKPDIWVYSKQQERNPFLFIEAIKKKAVKKDWETHIKRNYQSTSGFCIYTNGIEYKVYFNGVIFAELDFNLRDDRSLFIALIKYVDQLSLKKPAKGYKHIREIEGKYATQLSSFLRKDLNGRVLTCYLLVIGALEHSGYLKSNFFDNVAVSSKKIQEVNNLLAQRQSLPVLEDLRKTAMAGLNQINNVAELCNISCQYEGCIVNFRDTDSYTFSRLYEHVFTSEERKSFGIFATPKSVCMELVKKSYSDLSCNDPRDAKEIKVAVADIACGSGNFLEAFVIHVCENVSYGTLGVGIERRTRYKFTLFARDINIEAVCFAEVACTLALFKRSLHAVYSQYPLDIKFDFASSDSSDTSNIKSLNKYDYHLWLGNPPFVKQTNMSSAVVAKKAGKKNLGTIFLENMLTISSSKSVIGIVFQMALFGSQMSKSQSLLDQNGMKINHFIYFGQSKLFTQLVAQKWCCLVASKYAPSRTFKHVPSIKKITELEDIDNQIELYIRTQPEQILKDDLKLNNYLSFRMVSSNDPELAELLCLLPAHNLDIEAGIQASSEFDPDSGKPCFQVSESFMNAGKLSKKESAYLKPYWNESNNNGFYIKNHTSRLIDIPRNDFLEKPKREKKTTKEKKSDVNKIMLIKAETLFSNECLSLYKHLINFKSKISKMNQRTKPWFSLHRNRNGSVYDKNKVIIPQMLNWDYPVLAYIDDTEKGVGVPFNMNVIHARDEYRENWRESLVAWLNSGIIAFYLNGMNGAKPRGKGGEITGELVKKIPIPSCILFSYNGDEEILKKQDDFTIKLVEIVKGSKTSFSSNIKQIQSQIDLFCSQILELEALRIYAPSNNRIPSATINRDDWLESA